MKEVEVKLLGIDPVSITQKLLDLGAENKFEGLLKVRYFDKNDGEIQKKGDLLRVRQFGDNQTEVCYKTNKHVEDGYKVCDEYHLTGSNFEESVELFEKLGYKVTCAYEKRRTTFMLNNLEIVIDEYPQMPPFIEIEGENIQAIEKLIIDLELSENERSSRSIGGLLQEKYPDVELNGLKF